MPTNVERVQALDDQYRKFADVAYQPGLQDATGEPIPQPEAGCQIRYTGEGIAVYMLWGEPGRYYGEHGQEYPAQMASRAGYPVEEYQIMRKRRDAMAAAGQKVAAEFANMNTRVIEIERGDYKLVNLGKDNYVIEFADGSPVTPQAISKSIAIQVFDDLAPPEAKAIAKK